MMNKIETYAILAFVIAIASVLYVGVALGSNELEEEEEEKIHQEWAKENADSDIYQFVRCPNDTNTYPEGTKCNSSDEEEEDD